jgi:hypothetical protein
VLTALDRVTRHMAQPVSNKSGPHLGSARPSAA